MSNTLYFSFSLILHNIFALNSIQEWLNKVLLYNVYSKYRLVLAGVVEQNVANQQTGFT